MVKEEQQEQKWCQQAERAKRERNKVFLCLYRGLERKGQWANHCTWGRVQTNPGRAGLTLDTQ